MELTDLTKIIEIVILVIVAPLMTIAVAQLKRWIDANVTREQQAQIDAAVRAGVLAAEQMGLSGDEAKARALAIAEHQLARLGIMADLPYLSDLIEAVVMDEFNRWQVEHTGNV